MEDMATDLAAIDGPAAERSSLDEIIDLYKRDVDRTLLREALKKTPSERVAAMISMSHAIEELRRGLAARRT
jgi:hypothetical protein